MWLPIGLLAIGVLIVTTMAAMDRRGRRYHVLRSGREINGDVREERRDVRIARGFREMIVPLLQPRDRTPPDL
jgi:hypothetical protein